MASCRVKIMQCKRSRTARSLNFLSCIITSQAIIISSAQAVSVQFARRSLQAASADTSISKPGYAQTHDDIALRWPSIATHHDTHCSLIPLRLYTLHRAQRVSRGLFVPVQSRLGRQQHTTRANPNLGCHGRTGRFSHARSLPIKP